MTRETEDTAIPHSFDLEEWLDSVEGKEVVVDAPDDFPAVASCYYMPAWARVHREFYCSECDCMRFPVFDEHSSPRRHCPVCGNEPGALELGTDGLLTEVQPNEI